MIAVQVPQRHRQLCRFETDATRNCRTTSSPGHNSSPAPPTLQSALRSPSPPPPPLPPRLHFRHPTVPSSATVATAATPPPPFAASTAAVATAAATRPSLRPRRSPQPPHLFSPSPLPRPLLPPPPRPPRWPRPPRPSRALRCRVRRVRRGGRVHRAEKCLLRNQLPQAQAVRRQHRGKLVGPRHMGEAVQLPRRDGLSRPGQRRGHPGRRGHGMCVHGRASLSVKKKYAGPRPQAGVRVPWETIRQVPTTNGTLDTAGGPSLSAHCRVERHVGFRLKNCSLREHGN